MSQRKTKLLRIFQKHSQKIGEKIRFKTAHITLWGKISLLWSIICFLSLIFPWISITDTSFMHGEWSAPIASSFSSVLGGVWFFIFWTINLKNFFYIKNKKEYKFHFFTIQYNIIIHCCPIKIIEFRAKAQLLYDIYCKTMLVFIIYLLLLTREVKDCNTNYTSQI